MHYDTDINYEDGKIIKLNSHQFITVASSHVELGHHGKVVP